MKIILKSLVFVWVILFSGTIFATQNENASASMEESLQLNENASDYYYNLSMFCAYYPNSPRCLTSSEEVFPWYLYGNYSWPYYGSFYPYSYGYYGKGKKWKGKKWKGNKRKWRRGRGNREGRREGRGRRGRRGRR